MPKADAKVFIDLIQEKLAELSNIIGNLGGILTMDDKPAIETTARSGIDPAKLAESRRKLERFIAAIDKKEKGLELLYMRQTWLAKNNLTSKLEPTLREYDNRVKIKSYVRTVDRFRHDDPDEVVRDKIDAFILKTFKWLLSEKKQHRIDVNFPFRGGCHIAVS
jgi:hypothetical protein